MYPPLPAQIKSGLRPNDLQLVLSELYEEVDGREWENIGLALGLKPGILGGLKGDHKHPKDCLRDMLKEWLNRSDDPSWQSLIEALRKPSVGKVPLANTLKAKYCKRPAGIQFRTYILIDIVVTFILHYTVPSIFTRQIFGGSCFRNSVIIQKLLAS